MDFYLQAGNSYNRLEEEFKKYGKLIFCVDFDDTIYDYHKKGRTYENVINLLKRWEKYSEVIIFTGCDKEDFPFIEEYLKDNDIKYRGINCDSSVSFTGRKVYANVYIDDRAGLSQVYNELLTLIEKIENGEVVYNKLNPLWLMDRIVYGFKNMIDRALTPNSTSSKKNSYKFDPVEERNNIINWIKNWFDENGPECKCVVGISGGTNSTIVAKLCVEALGKERVYGVLMPQGNQFDIDDAKFVVEWLGIEHCAINIGNMVDRVIMGVRNAIIYPSDEAKIDLPARIRMNVLYSVSQSINGKVVNTCNFSENWIGNNVKYGDDIGDFAPISQFTRSEINEIGQTLSIPKHLILKTSADGRSGKTDEEIFGFTYEVLDKYIRTGICEDPIIKERIDQMRNENLFKHSTNEYNPRK